MMAAAGCGSATAAAVVGASGVGAARGSLPRSALVVAEPFAFGEAMAARPLWDRSRRDLLQWRPEAHLPGARA